MEAAVTSVPSSRRHREPADALVESIETARNQQMQQILDGCCEFLRLEQVPYRPDEPSRPVYVDPSAVAAVVPLDPRELEASYADLPDWLEQS